MKLSTWKTLLNSNSTRSRTGITSLESQTSLKVLALNMAQHSMLISLCCKWRIFQATTKETHTFIILQPWSRSWCTWSLLPWQEEVLPRREEVSNQQRPQLLRGTTFRSSLQTRMITTRRIPPKDVFIKSRCLSSQLSLKRELLRLLPSLNSFTQISKMRDWGRRMASTFTRSENQSLRLTLTHLFSSSLTRDST